MFHLTDHQLNHIGYYFEKLAYRLLECNRCRVRLERVDKPWVDLQCPICDLKVEVKCCMQKSNRITLSCGSAEVFRDIVSPHYLLVFQYEPIDHMGNIHIIRGRMFNLCTSTAIHSELFQQHTKRQYRRRISLQVNMMSDDSFKIIENDIVC